MRMSRSTLLLAAVVVLQLAFGAFAFFDKIGFGGGGGGGCGAAPAGGGCAAGGAAGAIPDDADETPQQFPASNVVYVFTGKSHTGKSFVAQRFADLISQPAQQQWNLTAETISFTDYILDKFAAENGVDAARYKSDYDYRVEHFAKFNRFSREFRTPMWHFDALDWALERVAKNAVRKAGQRRAFIFDDVQFRFQLHALQKLVASSARPAEPELEPSTAVPNAELFTIRLTASDEARTERGWRSGRAQSAAETDFDTIPATYWNKTFDNSGKGEDVVKVDNFLAQAILRTVAK